jgi:hypothetical protein
MEINGKVLLVGKTQQVTEKFKKRDMVIEYAENPTYPEQVKFEANQAGCEKLDELREGDEVTVHFNLRGRAWKDKSGKDQYFNTLSIWKVDLRKTSAEPTREANVVSNNMGDDSDGLPF